MSEYESLFYAFVARCMANGQRSEVTAVIRAACAGKPKRERVKIMVAGAKAQVADPVFRDRLGLPSL